MQLETRRFILRDFVDADLPAFVAYHADPRLRELYGPGENTPEHAAGLFQLFKAWAAEKPRQNYQLAIVRLDGQLIGCAGLRMKNAGPGRAELGVELAPGFQGRFGYAVEVIRSVVDFGFDHLGLDRIFGSTVSANARIARLAFAFGAVPVEQEAPAWMAARGWQQIEWQVDRTQWHARPAGKRL